MTKYIQGDDGKFAGSIGDGKYNVPTSQAESIPTGFPSVAAYKEAHTSEIEILYQAYTASLPVIPDDSNSDDEAVTSDDLVDDSRPVPVTLYDDPYTPAGLIRPVEEYPAVPGADGQTRTVRFTYLPERGEVEADFLLNGMVVDHKYLPSIEYDALSDAVNLDDEQGNEISAAALADAIDVGNVYFDSDYGTTHFEDVFYEFMDGN